MSQDVAASTNTRAHPWVAGVCAVVAYLSPAKFQGLSGWLGAGGWLLLALLVLTNPALAAARPRFTRHPRFLSLLLAIALSLVIASVVIWAIER